MKMTLDLTTDERLALSRFAKATGEELANAAHVALRDRLIGNGFLKLPHELGENTEMGRVAGRIRKRPALQTRNSEIMDGIDNWNQAPHRNPQSTGLTCIPYEMNYIRTWKR